MIKSSSRICFYCNLSFDAPLISKLCGIRAGSFEVLDNLNIIRVIFGCPNCYRYNTLEYILSKHIEIDEVLEEND